MPFFIVYTLLDTWKYKNQLLSNWKKIINARNKIYRDIW